MFDDTQNYKRLDSDLVFTGKQMNRLFEVAGEMVNKAALQAMILLGHMPTDDPATDPDSDYGPVAGKAVQ